MLIVHPHAQCSPRFPDVLKCLLVVWPLVQGADIHHLFQQKHCLPRNHQALFPFGHRKWVFEINPWASQRLSTVIAAILLREHLGYNVELNIVDNPSWSFHHAAKLWSGSKTDGETVLKLVRAGIDFGYANMEVWRDNSRDIQNTVAPLGGEVAEMGDVGYEGKSGWFVSEAFAQSPELPIMPEFYRAYDTSGKQSQVVLDALRKHYVVECSAKCCCSAPANCSNSSKPSKEAQWCPTAEGQLPAVISENPSMDAGFNEEIARSNGFQFALRFMGEHFEHAATDLVISGAAQVIHAFRPSTFLTRLSLLNLTVRRVMLPTEPCGTHHWNGTGTWSCDFPAMILGKLASMDAMEDPIVQTFMNRFVIPELSKKRSHQRSWEDVVNFPSGSANHVDQFSSVPCSALNAVRGGCHGSEDAEMVHSIRRMSKKFPRRVDLVGAGMKELMESLVSRTDAIRHPTADEIFDTACEWVRSNEDSGLNWTRWMPNRATPLFADSFRAEWPLPTLGVLLALACLYIAFMEISWLKTTLSPPTAAGLMRGKSAESWKTNLERRVFVEDKHTFVNSEASGLLGLEHHNHVPRTADMEISAADNHDMNDYGRELEMVMLSSQEVHHTRTCLENGYWEGLSDRLQAKKRANDFWDRVDAWERQTNMEPLSEPAPPKQDFVWFAHHTYPCFEECGTVPILIRRSASGSKSGGTLIVEAATEECGGGAISPRDFEAALHRITFAAGQKEATLHIQIVPQPNVWQNSSWFQVRLTKVLEGDGMLAHPSAATILIFDDDVYPANIPKSLLHDAYGINITKYYTWEAYRRRGNKWKTTMLAVMYRPFHNALSILLTKVLVDHAATSILLTEDDEGITWYYWECVILVGINFFSLGISRWADVVQTRMRGKTGGARQDHRSKLYQKFLQLEQAEHWEAKGADWLYCALIDTENIVENTYWQVFVLAQSLFALLLSSIFLGGLAIWQYTKNNQSIRKTNVGHRFTVVLGSFLGLCLTIPFSTIGVFLRQKLQWTVVVERMQQEVKWMKMFAHLLMNGRGLYGLTPNDRAGLWKKFEGYNSDFVKHHQVSRDVKSDTIAMSQWISGTAHCFMLLFGILALIDYRRFGVGTMEVGTYYALCKIYLNVVKHVGTVCRMLVGLNTGVVSLRKFATLLNMSDHRSKRLDAQDWGRCLNLNRRADLYIAADDNGDDCTRSTGLVVGCPKDKKSTGMHICLQDGLCFVRPHYSTRGGNFASLKIETGCMIPLGSIVFVSGRNEKVLSSFIGLVSQVVHPTDPRGGDVGVNDPTVIVPHGLHILTIPEVPFGAESVASLVLDELMVTGAARELCIALAECVGIAADTHTSGLSIGWTQIICILKAILTDPDILCMFRPLSLVPHDIRSRLAKLLRFWHRGSGLPGIAENLGVQLPQHVYRPAGRTLIVGDADVNSWGNSSVDIQIDLDQHLWKGALLSQEYHSEDNSTTRRYSFSNSL